MLTDFTGAMRNVTKAIAKECKVLETLCLDQCKLTLPIVDVLNRITTIKELRLHKLYQGRDNQIDKLAVILSRIRCPGVQILAMDDDVGQREAEEDHYSISKRDDCSMDSSDPGLPPGFPGSRSPTRIPRIPVIHSSFPLFPVHHTFHTTLRLCLALLLCLVALHM